MALTVIGIAEGSRMSSEDGKEGERELVVVGLGCGCYIGQQVCGPPYGIEKK